MEHDRIIHGRRMRLGSALTPAAQRAALARYVHRFTGDHKPAWAAKPWKDGRPYPVQFASDADWLAHTYFPVRQNGLITEKSGRASDCYSRPTWPHNPELRTPALDVIRVLRPDNGGAA